MSDFDLAVVGGGPGGYVAAERAAARGLRTALVERDHLGGVCLNSGCIPTKTLIHSAKLLQQARHGAAYGVMVEGVRYDLGAAMAWKGTVTERLRAGVAGQMERHGVTVEAGSARLVGRGRLTVDGRELGARHIIVATGSRAARPPIPGADLPQVVDSTGALQLEHLPGRVVIVGGGYIGMEFASYFHAVGVDVVVVEMLEEILAGVDGDIVRQLKSALPEVAWHLGSRVTAIGAAGVTIETPAGEREEAADLVLLATGRVPNTAELGLETVGALFNRRGITVDEFMRTNVTGLSAVGDVTGRSLLAHAASRMGEVAAGRHRRRASGQQSHALSRRAVGDLHLAGDRRGRPLGGGGARLRAPRAGGTYAAGGQRPLPRRTPGPGGSDIRAARLGRPRRAATACRFSARPGAADSPWPGQDNRGCRQPRAARRAYDRYPCLRDHLRRRHHDRGGAAGGGAARNRVPAPHGVGGTARRVVGSRAVTMVSATRRGTCRHVYAIRTQPNRDHEFCFVLSRGMGWLTLCLKLATSARYGERCGIRWFLSRRSSAFAEGRP